MKILYFDLETTGLDFKEDRVIEIAAIMEDSEGETKKWSTLVHPGRSIPAESSAIHGIKESDLKDAPSFSEIKNTFEGLILESDVLAGYNVIFDIKMMMAEFNRLNMVVSVHDKKVWDMQKIYFHHEPRTLVAAYRHYCDKDLSGAHRAMADIEATQEVFKAQIDLYKLDLKDPETLAFVEVRAPLDSGGSFAFNEKDEIILTFGKHRNKVAQSSDREVSGYLNWMSGAQFAQDTKNLARALSRGKTVTRANIHDVLVGK